MGLREFSNWNVRDDKEEVEPLKKYIFLCEGSVTEVAHTILKERAGVDSKSNTAIGKLAEFVTIAIEEERFLNQDINDCKGKITSNIGQIIDDILHDSV